MTTSAAIEALARGMVVGVPSDTVYGLALDPHNPTAVEFLFSLKARSRDLSLVLLAASLEAAGQLVDMTPAVVAAIDPHWPGALTAVLPASNELPIGVGDTATGTLAVRVPDQPVLRALIAEYGPLAVTSANRSGGSPALSADEARAMFGSELPVYVEGVCAAGIPSTIVDFTVDPPVVLREGPVVL